MAIRWIDRGTRDQSLPNSMFLHAFDAIRQWIRDSPRTDQLEQSLRRRRFLEEQNDLPDGDGHLSVLSASADLREILRSKGFGKGKDRASEIFSERFLLVGSDAPTRQSSRGSIFLSDSRLHRSTQRFGNEIQSKSLVLPFSESLRFVEGSISSLRR